MKTLKELFRFFLVYKCAGCGVAIKENTTLCEECKKAFMLEMRSPCPVCRAQQIECNCLSDGRKNPFYHVVHVAPYKGGNVTRGIVTGCKRVRDITLMRFVAYTVEGVMSGRIECTDKTCIIPIPRSELSKREYGFDQGEYVAKQIAADLGIECKCVIKHKGKASQKKLKFRERLKNAKDSFDLTDGTDLTGLHVILYDDVTTTGASALACEKLVKEAGAAVTDFVSFARAE